MSHCPQSDLGPAYQACTDRRPSEHSTTRPKYRSDASTLSNFAKWWLSNAHAVARYYRQCERALRDSGNWIAPVDQSVDLEAFAEIQYQAERWAYIAAQRREARQQGTHQ